MGKNEKETSYNTPQHIVVQAKGLLEAGVSQRKVAAQLDISEWTVKKIAKDKSLASGHVKASIEATKDEIIKETTQHYKKMLDSLKHIDEEVLMKLGKKNPKQLVEVVEKMQKIYRLETDQATENVDYHLTLFSKVQEQLKKKFYE